MNAQISKDDEIAKIHAEEELQQMIACLDRSNETIAKHLEEYDQSAAELTIRERIELISELVKYQDHHSKILNEELNSHGSNWINYVASTFISSQSPRQVMSPVELWGPEFPNWV
nr:hypothetical protein [Tanacetum cinerariifolium]